MGLFDEFGKQTKAIYDALRNDLPVVGEGGFVMEHKKTNEISGSGGVLCVFSGLNMEIVLSGNAVSDRIEHHIIVGRNLSDEQDRFLKGIVSVLNFKFKQVSFYYGTCNAPDDEWRRLDMNAFEDGTRYIRLSISYEPGFITAHNVMEELRRTSKVFMDITADFFQLLYTSIQK